MKRYDIEVVDMFQTEAVPDSHGTFVYADDAIERIGELERALADMLDLCQGSGPMPSEAEGNARCRRALAVLEARATP